MRRHLHGAPLRILVVDDHAIVAEGVDAIVRLPRFRTWLGSSRAIEVESRRKALDVRDQLKRYDAIVVDLRLPPPEPSATPPLELQAFCNAGYWGTQTLKVLENLGLLGRAVINSANVENMFEQFESTATPFGEVIKRWIGAGLTVCEKGRPVLAELEIHLLSLLHIASECQVISPESRRELLRLAHRGVRYGHLAHALIFGEGGSGKSFIARHLHALTGHYCAMLREERVLRILTTGLEAKEDVPELAPELTVLRTASLANDGLVADFQGQSEAMSPVGIGRYGLIAEALRSNQDNSRPREGAIRPLVAQTNDRYVDLYIDGLDDLPPVSQAALVRLLDHGDMRPTGADWSHRFRDSHGRLHVRVIASTSTLNAGDEASPSADNSADESSLKTTGAVASKREMHAVLGSTVRADLITRLGLPPFATTPLDASEIPALLELVWRASEFHDWPPPDQAIVDLFKSIVEQNRCPGGYRQLRSLVLEAYHSADERVSHPRLLESQSRRLLKDDLPTAVRSVRDDPYSRLARACYELVLNGSDGAEVWLDVLRVITLAKGNDVVASWLNIIPPRLTEALKWDASHKLKKAPVVAKALLSILRHGDRINGMLHGFGITRTRLVDAVCEKEPNLVLAAIKEMEIDSTNGENVLDTEALCKLSDGFARLAAISSSPQSKRSHRSDKRPAVKS